MSRQFSAIFRPISDKTLHKRLILERALPKFWAHRSGAEHRRGGRWSWGFSGLADDDHRGRAKLRPIGRSVARRSAADVRSGARACRRIRMNPLARDRPGLERPAQKRARTRWPAPKPQGYGRAFVGSSPRQALRRRATRRRLRRQTMVTGVRARRWLTDRGRSGLLLPGAWPCPACAGARPCAAP